MSPINSRSKGKRGEQEVVRIFKEHWPEASRNLDQFGDRKEDVLNVAGCHLQIKRVERLNVWAALKQTHDEARAQDLPVLVFRRNNGRWHAALELDELIALLRLRDA